MDQRLETRAVARIPRHQNAGDQGYRAPGARWGPWSALAHLEYPEAPGVSWGPWSTLRPLEHPEAPGVPWGPQTALQPVESAVPGESCNPRAGGALCTQSPRVNRAPPDAFLSLQKKRPTQIAPHNPGALFAWMMVAGFMVGMACAIIFGAGEGSAGRRGPQPRGEDGGEGAKGRRVGETHGGEGAGVAQRRGPERRQGEG